MFRIFAALLFVLFAGDTVCEEMLEENSRSPAGNAQLVIGQQLPSLVGIDDEGKAWKLSEHIGTRVMVLYFYPGDFTSGCIKQAHAFRAHLAELEPLGVEVVGISGDAVETHQLFKTSHGIRHTLLADPAGAIAKQLGIPIKPGARVRTRDVQGSPLLNEQNKSIFVQRAVTLPRWTLILDRSGALISLRKDVDPATDAEEVQRIINDLSKH